MQPGLAPPFGPLFHALLGGFHDTRPIMLIQIVFSVRQIPQMSPKFLVVHAQE